MMQKFRTFTKVKAIKGKEKNIDCFCCNNSFIVEGTYSQLCGGNDIKSYSLYVLSEDEKEIINCIAWIKEKHLTACENQNTKEHYEDMIEKYNLKRCGVNCD